MPNGVGLVRLGGAFCGAFWLKQPPPNAARPVPDAKALQIKALSTRRRQLVEMAALLTQKRTRVETLLQAELRKAVASLAGLAPHPNQSGTRTGQARISGGRPCVRAANGIIKSRQPWTKPA